MKILKAMKKPTVVDVMQFNDQHDAMEIETWTNQKAKYRKNKDTMDIETLEGVMSASSGDYIVKGVNGEFYPVKPDIFEKTYEMLNTSEQSFNNENFFESLEKRNKPQTEFKDVIVENKTIKDVPVMKGDYDFEHYVSSNTLTQIYRLINANPHEKEIVYKELKK